MKNLQKKPKPKIKKIRRWNKRTNKRRTKMMIKKIKWRNSKVTPRGNANWPSKNLKPFLPTPKIIGPSLNSTKNKIKPPTLSRKKYDHLYYIFFE